MLPAPGALLAFGAVGRMFKDIITTADGETYDYGRVLGVVWGVVYAWMGVYGALHATAEHAFDFQAYGIGAGAMATGVGALLSLKAKTEPSGQPTTKGV